MSTGLGRPSGFTHCPAALTKKMSYFSNSSVFIVGCNFNQNRYTGRTVTFVG